MIDRLEGQTQQGPCPRRNRRDHERHYWRRNFDRTSKGCHQSATFRAVAFARKIQGSPAEYGEQTWGSVTDGRHLGQSALAATHSNEPAGDRGISHNFANGLITLHFCLQSSECISHSKIHSVRFAVHSVRL
jgi:hypothetical protein